MSEFNAKNALKSSVAAVAVLSAMAAASVTTAQAGGFALREQSAIGQGASFAGVAAGGALSSMFWNPATLTQINGVNTESVFTGIMPSTKIKNLSVTSPLPGVLPSGDPGSVGMSGFVPSSYSGVQLNEDLFVGLSINAPFGLATKANNPSGTSFHSATAEIFTTDVKANIAYRINESFSVGAGLGVAYGKVRMTSTPNVSGVGIALSSHELQVTIGLRFIVLVRHILHWKGPKLVSVIVPALVFDLKGTETLAGTKKNISAKLDLPPSVTIGLRQKVMDRLTFLAGFEWTQWSSVKDPIAINNAVVAGSTLHLGYEDSWYASIGAEYAYNDELTVRTGLGFEKSPIPDNIGTFACQMQIEFGQVLVRLTMLPISLVLILATRTCL